MPTGYISPRDYDFSQLPIIKRWTPTKKKAFVDWCTSKPKAEVITLLLHYNISVEEYLSWCRQDSLGLFPSNKAVVHERELARNQRPRRYRLFKALRRPKNAS